MKLLSAITVAFVAINSFLGGGNYSNLSQTKETETIKKEAETAELSDFEKAVQIIKKYEGLHQPKHYPLVGYGHLVLPGEKFSRTKAMSEAEAEKLLRKDLLKNCAVFREWGADSLILGVLAYNIGSGNTLRSTVAKKLKNGDRDIYNNYIAHARYKGKIHSQIQRRRIEEFNTLFIKDPKKNTREIIQIDENMQSLTGPIASVRSTDKRGMTGNNLFAELRSGINEITGNLVQYISAFPSQAITLAGQVNKVNESGIKIKLNSKSNNNLVACI